MAAPRTGGSIASAGPTATTPLATAAMHDSHTTQIGTDDNGTTDQDRFIQDLENENPDTALEDASQTPVYPVLQLLRKDIKSLIDVSLSWEDLTGHDLNFALVRPLALKYSKLRSPAILYALLFTRIHFLRQAERDLAYRTVNETRAALCELLATKLLRTFASDGMELVTALAAPFWPWQGADQATLDAAKARGLARGDDDDAESQATSTLEYAIQSSAKKFVATPLVQKVVDGIWNGNVVLGNVGNKHALVDDSWKKRPVTLYDPSTSPLLDHRRLRVPRIRAFLEALNFVCILFLYAWCLGSKDTMRFGISEALFTLWLVGLAIDEVASLQEHGFSVYLGGSFFNVLDALFCTVGFTWLGFRVSSLITGSADASKTAFDILSLGAIILCPRLASLLVADNVLLLSLRAMIKDFFYFLALALVFFLGFTATFYLLADDDNWTVANISWLLLRFTFGNTIELSSAQAFTPIFGPLLVVSFTILAQTLLLTILISLLSSTFASVASHAQEVSLYQHACVALSASSSDAVFSYVPPTNIICLLIVYPASFFLTPRWLHKVNVWLIRATHLPVLLAIRLLQQYQWKKGIELATEKSGRMLDNWGWKTKRGQPDLIESVFHDLYDQSAIPSGLSNLFPTSEPISKTYSHNHLPTPPHSANMYQADQHSYHHHPADDTFESPRDEIPLSSAPHKLAKGSGQSGGSECAPATGMGAWGMNRSSTWKSLASQSGGRSGNAPGGALTDAETGEEESPKHLPPGVPKQSVSSTSVPTSATATAKKKQEQQQRKGHVRVSSFSRILERSEGKGFSSGASAKRSGSTSPPASSSGRTGEGSPSTSPRRRYSLLGRHRKGSSQQYFKDRTRDHGGSIDSVLQEAQGDDVQQEEEEEEQEDDTPLSRVERIEKGPSSSRSPSALPRSGSLGNLLELHRGSLEPGRVRIGGGGGGSDGLAGGTSEILMRLLDRIDDQAQAVERLESLLKSTIRQQKKESMAEST